MKLTGGAVEAFMRRPDPAARAVVVYGPDSGLVRERAAVLARLVVPDLNDPFRVAELAASAVAKQPPLLPDEAAALAFGGGRRVVRVRDAGDEVAPALAGWLADPRGEALVVIEAGDLPPRSALRKLAEGAPNAAALPCYADEGRTLVAVIAATLAEEHVKASPDALAWLAAHLGGDRLVTRGELRKLALFVGAGGTAEVADALAVVGDSADISLDEVGWALGDRDPARLVRAIARAQAEGVEPVRVLRGAGRHIQRLATGVARVAEGMPEERVVAGMRPPIHWKQQERFKRQLGRWTLRRLNAALQRLNAAEIGCKTTGMPAAAVAEHALLSLAAASVRRDGF